APTVAPVASVSMQQALLVMIDPDKRADTAQRLSAAAQFSKTSASGGALADVATAGWLFLSKSDVEWGLSSDAVVVKGPSGESTYKGRLDKRSDTVSVLILADRKEVRIRTAGDGKFITPPGASEFKAA